MSTAALTRSTPEDLLVMPDGKGYELVDGELLERPMGAESDLVAGDLYPRVAPFCNERGLGRVWSNTGYQCFPHDPGMVRRPNLSFVRAGRLAGNVVPKGWIRNPPDLAVEVISPNDRVYQLDAKLADYRKVRIHLVWTINPESRTATVYRADGSVRILFEDDELSGEDVIPGFRCRLRDILPKPESAQDPVPSAGPNGTGPA